MAFFLIANYRYKNHSRWQRQTRTQGDRAASEMLCLEPAAIASKVVLYQPATPGAGQPWVGLFSKVSVLCTPAQTDEVGLTALVLVLN